METWTVRRLLGWTAERFGRERFETPRLDAELLLAHALGLRRIDLYTDHDRPLAAAELERYRELVRRRLEAEPVAYLIGRREFWSLELKVDPRALVPRPESEALVEEALACLAARGAARVLDVGTGSGAIAIAIAKERPDVEVWASDVSADAVALASENAAQHGVTVRFSVGSLLEAVRGERFDAILANLPYLKPEEVRPSLRHEPRIALTDEHDGLTLVRRLIDEAPELLLPGALLALEAPAGRTDDLVELLRARGAYGEARTRRDLSGIERVVAAERQ